MNPVDNSQITRIIIGYLADTPLSTEQQEALETDISSSILPVIPLEAAEKIRAFILENLPKIQERQNDETLHFYAGKHCIVFTHHAYPNLVLKIMSPQSARESLDLLHQAREQFSKKGFRYCHIPCAEITHLSQDQDLFIMEKATGEVDEERAQELMEQEFRLIPQDPKVAKRWQEITSENAEATALIGYWDSQRKNLIWDPRKGFSYIDFERVSPTKDNQLIGLERLVDIFPYQFIGEIYTVAENYGIRLGESLQNATQRRMNDFMFSWSRSEWNATHPFPRVVDPNKYSPTSWEGRMINEFLTRRAWYRSPRLQTELYIQPLQDIFDGMIDYTTPYEQQIRCLPEGMEIYRKARAELDAALDRMQLAGDIHAWKAEEIASSPREVPYLIGYTIYF